MPDSPAVGLSAAVSAIRDELVCAADTADQNGEAVRFEVGAIEMEFTVELRHEAGVRGGFKAWVVTGEADARTGRAQTHRVAFTLTPRDRTTGRSVEVGNDLPGNTADLGSIS